MCMFNNNYDNNNNLIQWLKEDFMGWLDEWESCVESREDLSLSEKDRLCLSRETLDGLRFTGTIFLYRYWIYIFSVCVHSEVIL